MAISFSIYNFFDLGPLFQEHNYGVKQGLGIHVPITEVIFEKCQISNLRTYTRTKKNNTKYIQNLTLSWFIYAYSQIGIENLLLQKEEKPQWSDHMKTTDWMRIRKIVFELNFKGTRPMESTE